MSNDLKNIASGKTKKALGNGGGGSGEDSPVVTPAVGDELVGTYEGSSTYPSKFNADKTVSYFRFTAPDGSLFTLRSKGDLEDGMAEAEPKMLISIERLPDKQTKSGYAFAQFVVSELTDDTDF